MEMPPPDDGATLRESLTFAQSLADREITAIERLHQRSVRYIIAVLGAGSVVFGVFGFIGYKDLRDTAVHVAQQQVREEVTHQVQQKLTKEDINGVVGNEVRNFAASELRNQIHADLSAGPLHDEIVHIAERQSRSMVDTIFAPRHLTLRQRQELQGALAQYPDLKGFPVATSSITGNLEAERFEKELKAALTFDNGPQIMNGVQMSVDAEEGITVIYDRQSGPHYADELSAALNAAHLHSVTTFGNIFGSRSARAPIGVWVGPQVITRSR